MAVTELDSQPPDAAAEAPPPSARRSKRRRRKNHWAKQPPEEFVRYPRSEPLPYLKECRLVRLAQGGDRDALRQLWVQHLRLVFSVANHFRIPDALLADAMQEGALGLKVAIEKFEVERYNSFSTYAWRWIYQNIQRFLVAHLFVARLPDYLFPDYMRFRRDLTAAGTPGGEQAVFDRWRGGDARTYRRVLAVYAFAEPVPVHLLDREAHPVAPAEEPPNEIDWRAVVGDALRTLKDREREVIILRYGLSGAEAMSLKEVGQRYGLTRERIRQIQAKAERRLRRRFERSNRVPYDHHDQNADQE